MSETTVTLNDACPCCRRTNCPAAPAYWTGEAKASRAALESKPAATQEEVDAKVLKQLADEFATEVGYQPGTPAHCSASGKYYLEGKAHLEAYFAAMPKAQPVLTEADKAEALDLIADQQANGWEYGTHPREKARIVLAALLERYRLVRKP